MLLLIIYVLMDFCHPLLTFRKSCSSSFTQADLLLFDNDSVAQWGVGAATGFCQDSASVIRVFQTQSGSDYGATDDNGDNNNVKKCDIKADSMYTINNCDDLKM
jgi:hypothetical protein